MWKKYRKRICFALVNCQAKNSMLRMTFYSIAPAPSSSLLLKYIPLSYIHIFLSFSHFESISGNGVCMYVWMYVCKSSLQRWWIRLLVGFTDPYNHTYSESLWWKLFKNHQKTQIQRQRQWQRQRQRQRHRKSAWNTQLMLYFWNPDDLLIPNMMIDTSP